VSPSEAAPPTRENLLAELRSWMQSEFSLKPEQIEPATHLIDDLDFDSIDLVDLAVLLEERLGFKLDNEELNSVETVGDAVNVIHAALVRRSAGAA
jgi:acyl carrier protein